MSCSSQAFGYRKKFKMTHMQNTPDSVPWQDTYIPVHLRMMGFIVIIFLFGLILWSALMLIAAVLRIIMTAQVPLEMNSYIGQAILALIGLVFGLFGWRSVRRYAFGHDDFRPRTSVAPTVLGAPIDMAMSKPIHGSGMLQFTDSGIEIRAENTIGGHLGGGADFVADLIVSLILTGIAYLLFKRIIKIDWGYEQITDLKVVGRSVVVFALDGTAHETKFKVSSHDGERLYRELNAHYPRAIEEWRHLLA
jgi:hypothetical protein